MMTRDPERAPEGNHRLGRAVPWIVITALVLGVALGRFSGWFGTARGEQRAVVDGILALILVFTGTVQCSEIVRAGPDNRLLLACILLLVPLSAVYSEHLAPLRGTLGVVVTISATAIWLTLFAACLNLKRRLALWCVWLAGAVGTSAVLLHWAGLGGA